MSLVKYCMKLMKALEKKNVRTPIRELCIMPNSKNVDIDCLELIIKGERCRRYGFAHLQLYNELQKLENIINDKNIKKYINKIKKIIERENRDILQLFRDVNFKISKWEKYFDEIKSLPPHVVCIGNKCVLYSGDKISLIDFENAREMCIDGEPPCLIREGRIANSITELDLKYPRATYLLNYYLLNNYYYLINNYLVNINTYKKKFLVDYISFNLSSYSN